MRNLLHILIFAVERYVTAGTDDVGTEISRFQPK